MVKQRQTQARSKAIDDFVSESEFGDSVKVNLKANAVFEKNYSEVHEEEEICIDGFYRGFRTETSGSGEKSLELKVDGFDGDSYRVNEKFIRLIRVPARKKEYRI